MKKIDSLFFSKWISQESLELQRSVPASEVYQSLILFKLLYEVSKFFLKLLKLMKFLILGCYAKVGIAHLLSVYLTHLIPLVPIASWKHQETTGFLVLAGGIEKKLKLNGLILISKIFQKFVLIWDNPQKTIMNSLPVLQFFQCLPSRLRVLSPFYFSIDYVVIREKDYLLLLLFSTVSRK